jgi:hypothetical protein
MKRSNHPALDIPGQKLGTALAADSWSYRWKGKSIGLLTPYNSKGKEPKPRCLLQVEIGGKKQFPVKNGR